MHSSRLETSVPLSHLAVFWRSSRLFFTRFDAGFQRDLVGSSKPGQVNGTLAFVMLPQEL